MHGDGIRTLAVLVVSVVPDLGDIDVDSRRIMGVGEGGRGSGNGFLRQPVAADVSLIPRVGDCGASRVLIQSRDGSSPAVALIEGNGLSSILAVGEQLHGEALRAETVLVVAVIPNLGDGSLGLLGLVRVGDGGLAVRGFSARLGVTSGEVALVLFPRVSDLLAAGVLVNRNLGGPAVVLGERCGRGGCGVARVKGHDEALRTCTVLVVAIVPNLLDGYFSRLGRMAIRNGAAVLGRAASSGVVLDCGLGHGVFAVDGGNAGPSNGPGVSILALGNRRGYVNCRRQRQRLEEVLIGRTEAVMIVAVIPDLGDGNIRESVLVREGSLVCLSIVSHDGARGGSAIERKGVIIGAGTLGFLKLESGGLGLGDSIFCA